MQWKQAVRWAAMMLTLALAAGCGRTISIHGDSARAMELHREVGQRSDYYLRIIDAENAIMRGDLEGARAIYRELVETNPKDAAAFRLLAQLHVHEGDLDGAIGYARTAYRLAPSDLDTAVMYGGLLAAKGDVSGAGDVYRAALTIDPASEEIPLLLAGLLVVEKRFDEARAVLADMAARHPESALAAFEQARIELMRDDCVAAEPHLEKTLEINQNFSRAEIALGMCREEADDDEAALRHYERALEIEPDNAALRSHVVRLHVRGQRLDDANRENEKLRLFQFDDADVRVNRGLILFYQARFHEAITELNLVLAGDPQNAQALYFLALCLTRLNQIDAAYDAYARIPEASPYYVDGLAARGALLRRMNRLGDAETLLRSALTINPEDTYLRRTLALVVADQNRLDEAVIVMEDALKLTPEDASLTYVLANIYERAGQWQKGIELMEEVLVKEPKNADALNFIGYTLVERGGDLARAEDLLKHAVKLRPNDGYIADSYGWLLYKRGKYREAVHELKRAHELIPDEAVVAEHVGDCQRALGRKDDARLMYQRALELFPEPALRSQLMEKLRELE